MDLMLHGAGQSPEAFKAYWDFMPNSTKPMLYMAYVGLNASSQEQVQQYFEKLEEECASYTDEFYTIPQIGLSMTRNGQGYDGAVASGELDEQIGWLVDALQHTLKRPAYIRIGYEFNGEWNGYNSKTYPQAFARVAKAVRATQKVRVAAARHHCRVPRPALTHSKYRNRSPLYGTTVQTQVKSA
jgi:hypothetical protein